jgi:hypothetical protein
VRSARLRISMLACTLGVCSGCTVLDTKEVFPDIQSTKQATALASSCGKPEALFRSDDDVPRKIEFLKAHLDELASDDGAVTAGPHSGGALGKILDAVGKRLTMPPGSPVDAPSLGPLDLKALAEQLHGRVARSPLSLSLHLSSVEPPITPQNANDVNEARLLALAFYYYFDALFNGKYVDRMGVAIQAPALSGTVSDAEISAIVTVFVDVLLDFMDRRPVWVDVGSDPTSKDFITNYKGQFYPHIGTEPGSSKQAPTAAKGDANQKAPVAAKVNGKQKSQAAAKASGGQKGLAVADPQQQQPPASQKSGGSSNMPTAVAFEYDQSIAPYASGWAKLEPLYDASTGAAARVAAHVAGADAASGPSADPPSTKASYCGIDASKAKAMYFVSQLVNQEVSGMTGLSVGSFGGLGIAFGVFGKLSIGDNQTVSSVLKAVLSRVGQRTATGAAYHILYSIDDSGLQPAQLITEYMTIKKAH